METRTHQLNQLINKHLPDSITPLSEETSGEELMEAVRKRLKFLLDTDMERLLHTLYRIDVAENRVREILSSTDPDLIDTALTELVIERIRQKLETRRKYSQH
ncbi:hypothetical protein [Fulvivirga sedimenti]|uniref:Uncharacterized protein n=1 Tax=Fulvivirga sedimenti TaxID=2879465 RepID=A0A9X1KZ95_9BACT|nr:hypothetical protein [Fulvivirga sedimenti]MCA6078005.1 hypothetical protein [Fulvivirga sedimenti]